MFFSAVDELKVPSAQGRFELQHYCYTQKQKGPDAEGWEPSKDMVSPAPLGKEGCYPHVKAQKSCQRDYSQNGMGLRLPPDWTRPSQVGD